MRLHLLIGISLAGEAVRRSAALIGFALLAAMITSMSALASSTESVRVVFVSSEGDFELLTANGSFRPGNVVVLDVSRLQASYVLDQFSFGVLPGDSGSEPTYLVSLSHYEATLEKHSLDTSDFEQQRGARALLLEAPIEEGASVDSVFTHADWRVGGHINEDALAPLAFPRLEFGSGAWAMVGFDVHGHTNEGVLIRVHATAHLIFSNNRVSNCTPDLLQCAWHGEDENGIRKNGGQLLSIRSETPGTVIQNNIFEDLRGFLLIALSNASNGVEISQNTFQNVGRWGNNAAEAIMLGSVPIVLHPTQDPPLAAVSAQVAQNWFNDYWGEDELISVKSSGNRIVRNVITDSGGGVSMRDGADTLVERNLFVRARSIRIMGDRQSVRENRIILPRGFGIWFENGASRAGYLCRGNRVRQLVEPLRWIYRPAREPLVERNTIEVALDSAPAIGRRDLDKGCGFQSCTDAPSNPIPCHQNVSDAYIASLFSPAGGNSVVTLDHDTAARRSQEGLLPGHSDW